MSNNTIGNIDSVVTQFMEVNLGYAQNVERENVDG